MEDPSTGTLNWLVADSIETLIAFPFAVTGSLPPPSTLTLTGMIAVTLTGMTVTLG